MYCYQIVLHVFICSCVHVFMCACSQPFPALSPIASFNARNLFIAMVEATTTHPSAHVPPNGSRSSRAQSRSRSRQRAVEKVLFDDPADGASQSLDYKKAAGLRFKYRIPSLDGSGKHKQPPNWVGHHPSNRDGTKMSAERCEELLEAIIGQFDPDEADHDAVCVEQGDETHITKWTQMSCDEEPTMADVCPQVLRDGGVGHTHLNQCMANVLGKALVTRPGLKQYCDSTGRLSLTKVTAVDPELGEYCQRGLAWERLSKQLEVEEPGGIVLIQSMLNRKRDMQMVEHEMQVLSRLANVVLQFSKQKGHQISVDMAREKLAAEGMPQVAHSAEFPGLLNAVLQWGGAEGIHFINLKKFHEACVNAKVRRIRLSIFIALGEMCVEYPLVRNLLAEYAYSASAEKKQLEDGFCNKLRGNQIFALAKPAKGDLLRYMEGHLHDFHISYQAAGVYSGMSQTCLARLMCKVDLMMSGPLLQEAKADEWKKLIDEATSNVQIMIRALVGAQGQAER